MSSKNPKLKLVAFKADAHLAKILNELPNKSEFIRKAIAAQIGTTCPLCQGKGLVPRGIHAHFEPIISKQWRRPCDVCGDDQPLPASTGDPRPEDRARLEQFFMGGPLYCDDCYRTAPLCNECGWHVDSQRINDHVRELHAHRQDAANNQSES